MTWLACALVGVFWAIFFNALNVQPTSKRLAVEILSTVVSIVFFYVIGVFPL